MPKLTKRFLDALEPVERDTLYRDSALTGFALRVKPSGIATWCIQYRDALGRTKRHRLGAARKLGETGSAKCLRPTKRASGLKKPLGAWPMARTPQPSGPKLEPL